MSAAYPPIEPYDSGTLDVDGHRVHWETSGSPDGTPVVVLHGGPGGAGWTGGRRWFDPDRYRIVGFDQRVSGRSLPSAADPMRPLVGNTTHHLIDDMERLRKLLAIDRWLVCGAAGNRILATPIPASACLRPHRHALLPSRGVAWRR